LFQKDGRDLIHYIFCWKIKARNDIILALWWDSDHYASSLL